MENNPLKRLRRYSKPAVGGGLQIDVNALMIDLITAAKFDGATLEQVQMAIAERWPQVEASAIPVVSH